MFLFQIPLFAKVQGAKVGATINSPGASSSKIVSSERLLIEAKNIVLPAYMERAIVSFAKKVSSDGNEKISRDQQLAVVLQSMGITEAELANLKTVKWTRSDAQFLRQTLKPQCNNLSSELTGPMSKALAAGGHIPSKSNTLDFVEKHIDMFAASLLLKFKGVLDPGTVLKLASSDVSKPGIIMGEEGITFHSCIDQGICSSILLVQGKGLEKVQQLMTDGQLDAGKAKEILGEKAFENIHIIAKSIYKALDEFAVKIANEIRNQIPDIFMKTIGEDAMARQGEKSKLAANNNAYEQSKKFLDEWNDRRGGFV